MHKAVLPALLAATTLLAVAGCGDDPEDDPTLNPTTAAPTATAPTTAAPTTAQPTPTATAAVQTLTIVVKGGKATGDTGTVKVAKGVPFKVTVISDIADEVHVHSETREGFPKDVEAGGTVTVDAVIKAPGKYEVELEHAKLKLATLEVR